MRRGPWFPEAIRRCRTTRRCRPRRQAADPRSQSRTRASKPGYRQSSLIRASQVVLIMPRQLPRSLPLKYWPSSRVARRTRLELPSRNTFWRSSRYMPHDRREHVVLPVLHRPLRRIGACTGRAVELVLENVRTAVRYWAAAQRAPDPPGGTAKHRLWVGGSRPPRGRSRTSTSCCDDPSEAREHLKGRTRSRARFTDGFCVSGLAGNLGAD